MKPKRKKEHELLQEIEELRRKVADLRRVQAACKRAEKALQASNELNRAILGSLTNTIAVLDRAGTIVAVNDAWKRFAVENGAPALAEQSVGLNYLEICRQATGGDDEAASKALAGIKAVLGGSLHHFTLEYPCHSPDEKRWFLLYATPLASGRGGAVVSHINITGRKTMEETLQSSAQRFRMLLEAIPNGVEECDANGLITFVNEHFAKMTGYSKDEMLTMRVWDLMEPGAQKDSLPGYLQYLVEKQPAPEPYFCRDLTKDGRVVDVQIDWVYKRDDEGRVAGFICIVSDITERKRMEETIRRQATHDVLTGLPNRLLFMDHLALALNNARRTGERLATLFLDLDEFKAVNDTLGHGIGDKMLAAVADRLKTCVRSTDTVARIGGDECTILLTPVIHKEDVDRIAEKILSHVREPMILDGNKLHITVSIGISIHPENGADADTLLKNADIAMYYVKKHGKNNYAFYEPSMSV